MPEFYIRADANSQIATGHVMRCMSIADALEKKGCRCIFVTADREGESFVKARGYQAVSLDSEWNRLETEADKIEALIRERKISRLLVDSYFVTENYLKRISSLTKIFYIDDLNRFLYPVDTVINYSICADQFHYEERYKKAGLNTRFLLGCEYVPLRSEFWGVSYSVRNRVKNILITTGGTDHYNIAGKLAERMSREGIFDDIVIHIVVGAYNENKEYLKELGSRHKGIVLHENITKMAELMLACDLAVTAGGTTTYELCACGIPSIALALAENQLDNVKRFEKEELLLYAGDVTQNETEVLETVLACLKKMTGSRELRQQFSLRMQEKKLQNGSRHLAEAML